MFCKYCLELTNNYVVVSRQHQHKKKDGASLFSTIWVHSQKHNTSLGVSLKFTGFLINLMGKFNLLVQVKLCLVRRHMPTFVCVVCNIFCPYLFLKWWNVKTTLGLKDIQVGSRRINFYHHPPTIIDVYPTYFCSELLWLSGYFKHHTVEVLEAVCVPNKNYCQFV